MNTNQNVIIRNATRKDIEKLSELLSLLFSQELEFSVDPLKQRAGLEMILSDPGIGVILLAEKAQEIIGMVNLLFTISTALGGRVALLEDMIIAPNYQRQKIGSQLLQKAINEAKKQDCLRITLLTDADNCTAQSFYTKQGFVRSDMMTYRQLLSL